jgi:potassium efflux system protein
VQTRVGRTPAARIGAALPTLLLLVLLPFSWLSRAEDDKSLAVPRAEAIEPLLAALKDAPADDARATRLRELYTATLQALRAAAVDREDAARFERLQADAPTRMARHAAELQKLARSSRASTPSASIGVARLERRLDETETRLAALRAEESALSNTLATLQARVDTARRELKALGEQPARSQGTPVPQAGEDAAVSRARIGEWAARQDALSALRQRLETETRTLPARIAVLQSELKLASAEREQTERALNELLGLEHLRRIAEASELQEDTAARLADFRSGIPALQTLADELGSLAAEYVDAVTRQERERSELAVARRSVEELRSSLAATRQQLEIAELSDALGPLFAEQYRRLDALEQSSRPIAALSAELSRTRLREFRLRQLRDGAGEYRDGLESSVLAAYPVGDESAADQLVDAEALLDRREHLLEMLGEVYLQLTAQVIEREGAWRDQAALAAEFRTLLDRNLVWMPSHPPLGLASLVAWPSDVTRLLSSAEWEVLRAGLGPLLADKLLAVAALAAVLLLWWRYQPAWRARLATLGPRQCGWTNYRFPMALQALSIHLVLVLPVPIGLSALASLLRALPDGDLLAAALADSVQHAAEVALAWLFLLRLVSPDGFAEQHLRWNTERLRSVEGHLRTALPFVLPLVFFVALLRELGGVAEGAAASRLAGVALALVMACLAGALIRAGTGITSGSVLEPHDRMADRMGHALLLAVTTLPLLHVVLEITGFHFTATALAERMLPSLVLLGVARLVLDTGLLGLTIAIERTRETLQAEPESAAEEVPAAPELERMNASAVAVLQLVVFGTSLIMLLVLWSQFFTALSILDTVTLWQDEVVVDGKQAFDAVSLLDLLLSLLLIAATFALARGLPALLGLVLLPFVTRKGLLFTIQTLIGYALIAVGVIASFQQLGLGWGKLQWMAAGLSVGLGFGLQEIFANFFAGLIMLFERPVRIGDVISLGEYSGTIQRIRMRSTTIVDFDNREIIVPNKAFVTERLINWTLSSSVVRTSFDVGVSYDADPRLVQGTLLGLLQAEPRVLKDPPPSVVFREFGASSLNFRCFAYVEDLSLRALVLNDLHMRITEVFRELGIEIAYPQMDLHVKTVDGQHSLRASG